MLYLMGKWKSRKAETGTGTGTEKWKRSSGEKTTELNGSHHSR